MMASSKKPASEKSTPETTPQPSKHPWESPEPTPPQNPADHPSHPSDEPIPETQPKDLVKTKDVPVAQDDVPVNIPPDPLQAVDCANQKINIGDAVYFVGIVQGFRADINNRLNILVMPMYNIITNNDPGNPLIGAVDAKLLPMSGYHCVNTGPIGNVADVFTPITDPLLTQLRELAQKAADTVPTPLPSNFLVPSYA